jgi:hypothetical protein
VGVACGGLWDNFFVLFHFPMKVLHEICYDITEGFWPR